jgi:TonB family protein
MRVQFKHLPKRTFPLLLTLLAVSPLARAQEKAVSSPTATPDSSEQPNTAARPRQILEAMLQAAKSDDLPKLAALVKSTEVPDRDAWLHGMYRSEHADSWMSLCNQNDLGPNEKELMEQFVGFAKRDGQIGIRSVNDEPEPGKGMEWGMLDSLRKPLDIYTASWKTSANPKGEPIGYFMFIDGGFRGDSRIHFITPKIGNFKLVPAKLVTRVEPVYSPEAADQHISGTVRVYFVIGADGVVYNAHAISGDGLSDNLSLRKAAEDAVIRWRFTPATVDGKPAQSNAVTADVAFAP